MELEKNSMQPNLIPGSNRSTITILGNTDVKIQWHHRDFITVSPIHKENFGIQGLAKYEVKLLKAKSFQDKTIITLSTNVP
ncbi:hypothetical protein RIF29_19197 [Crotalaria pallida]|uniref:Nuclear pore complex protein GP210 C-terminal Ig-like domain-containing protein n=1 Tax=Crotalaria pallida TaxID=3830 RepID=A0AAN9EZ34_CROPI